MHTNTRRNRPVRSAEAPTSPMAGWFRHRMWSFARTGGCSPCRSLAAAARRADTCLSLRADPIRRASLDESPQLKGAIDVRS